MMSIKRIYLIVIAGIILSFIASCGMRNTNLREAESLLETAPRAADSILSTMPQPTKNRDRALYAVLKTQAEYKQYKPITSDSLILTATRYYGTNRKNYHAALAWYTQGCVYTELHDDIQAIDAYLKAKDLFPDTLVRYYALCEQKSGTHLLNRMMLKPAIQQFECCLKNAIRLNDDKMSNYVSIRLGLSALYSEDYIKADSIFSMVINNPGFSYSHQTTALLQMSKICLNYKRDYPKALEYVNSYIRRYNEKGNTGAGYCIKADIYYEMHQYDSAYYYYIESINNTSDIYTQCASADRLANLSLLTGENDISNNWHILYGELRDSINKKERARDIEELQYNHNESLLKEKYNQKQKLIITISFFSIVILGFILFLFYTLFKNRERKRIMKKQQELINIEEEIRRSSVEVIETRLIELSVNNPQTRNSLLDLYTKRLTMGDIEFQYSDSFHLLSFIRTGQGRLNKEERDALFKQLKLSYIESISDILKEIPDIKEAEILSLLFKHLSFSNKQIADIYSITEDAVKKRFSRLSLRAPSDLLSIYT